MVATQFVLAASSVLALSYGAPVALSKPGAARSLVERAAYNVFGGDGTTAQGWPAQGNWKSFEDLWTINEPTIKISCTQFGVDNNSDEETAAIKAGIQSASSATGMPESYILAIIMQESKGCVRVPTTNWGVRNPGLMQDHDGKGTCNEGGVQNPCPSDTIALMIAEGAGQSNDFGLKQTIAQAGCNDVSKYYKGARIYNSGSLPTTGNLGGGVATHCYASDVANRLVGWDGSSTTCQEGSIGSVLTSSGNYGQGSDSAPSDTPSSPSSTKSAYSAPSATAPAYSAATSASQPVSTAPAYTAPAKSASSSAAYAAAPSVAPTPSPATPTYAAASVAAAAAPSATIALSQAQESSSNSGTSSTPTASTAPGVPQSCKSYYTVVDGDYCQKIEDALGLARGTIAQINTQVGSDCQNLWKGYAYCTAQ